MKRRNFIQLSAMGLGSSILSSLPSKAPVFSISKNAPEVLVIGAGAFGGWASYHLRKKGASVTLLDAYGPGNSRASSGGETRLMQIDNDSHVYVKSGIRAYGHWKELEEISGQELVLPTGRLSMSTDELARPKALGRKEQLLNYSIKDTEILDQDEIRRRWPQIYANDLQFALFNAGGPAGSTLLARKGCQTVAAEFTKLGGKLQLVQAFPMTSPSGAMEGVKSINGEVFQADHYVFACGPWLGKLFPGLLGNRLRDQRRDVLFYGLPPGDARFAYPNFPEWSVQGSGWYGFPDIENRGLKAAPYPDHNSIDPDTDERIVTPQQVKRGHDFLRHRFPSLAEMPITETRVCQVTNSIDSNFIIDKHPGLEKVWIAGGGSGHGFKHGPSIGEYISQRVLGEPTPEDYDSSFRLKADTF